MRPVLCNARMEIFSQRGMKTIKHIHFNEAWVRQGN